jgi:hypothetical protein
MDCHDGNPVDIHVGGLPGMKESSGWSATFSSEQKAK